MRSITLTILIGLIIFTVGTIVLLPLSAHSTIPAETTRVYPLMGSHVGVEGASIGQVIDMRGMSSLTFILNLTGTNLFYNNTNMTVQVNQEGGGGDWLTAGTIALGNVSNVTTVGRSISYDNYTGFDFNPAGFPFVRISTDVGITNSVETLYWTGTLR